MAIRAVEVRDAKTNAILSTATITNIGPIFDSSISPILQKAIGDYLDGSPSTWPHSIELGDGDNKYRVVFR